MSSRGQIFVNLFLVLFSIGVALVLCELGLRLLYGSPSEQPLDYKDTWRQVDPGDAGFGVGGFLKEGFKGYVQDGFGGTVRWSNNSQGFRNDVDFPVPKLEETYRILSLGDSFTAGYRVGQTENFSALAEKTLAKQNPEMNFEVLVSVIEDPALGLLYLQQHGLQFEPNLVILGITLGNDIHQTSYRLLSTLNFDRESGRLSRNKKRTKDLSQTRARFEAMKLPTKCLTDERRSPDFELPLSKNGDVQRKSSAFWITELFRQAMRSRSRKEGQTVISGYNAYDEPRLWDSHGLGFFLKEAPPEVLRAYDALFDVLEGFSKTTAENGAEFLAVIFPQRFQVRDADWVETQRAYRLRQDCFELDRPNALIMRFCAEKGINCIDPTERFRGVRAPLYLPNHDMHWNADGHAVLAEALVSEVENVMQPSGALDGRGNEQEAARDQHGQ